MLLSLMQIVFGYITAVMVFKPLNQKYHFTNKFNKKFVRENNQLKVAVLSFFVIILFLVGVQLVNDYFFYTQEYVHYVIEALTYGLMFILIDLTRIQKSV